MDWQPARFLLVGLACAGLFFVVNFAVLILTGSPLVGLLAAYVVCFPVGYLLQRNFTFAAPILQDHHRGVPRYAALHGGGFAAVYLATLTFEQLMPGSALLSAALTTGLAGIASFFISRGWVFRPGKEA